MQASAPLSDERMLRSLAEQLKVPLTLIARQSELGSVDSLSIINLRTQDALRLIEAYLLTGYLHGQQQLQLEPVPLKALMYDVAHELEPLAKQAGKRIDLVNKGRFGQAIAHHEALKTALTLLGKAFLSESFSSGEAVRLQAYKYENRIQVGMYSQNTLTAEAFAVGQTLYGKAHQAVPSAHPAPATEIYLADSLLQSMAATLQVSKHGENTGLVTNLMPNQQLALI